MSENINVDINFEADLLTGGSTAQLIISIFEILLFQRNQIPFVFGTFKYLISKWKNLDETDNNNANFNILRQRKAAISTLKEIKKIIETIKELFKSNNEILSIRFLFGATPQLPKEIYHIKIPFITKTHSDELHWCSVDNIVKTILRNVLTSEHLYKIFSSTLRPTNVFLDVEFKSSNENLETDSLTIKDYIEFPPSCKQIILNLNFNPTKDFTKLECCKNLKIFIDDNHLNSKSLKADEVISHNIINWCEANYFVKGFKDKNTTNTLNIWKNDE